MELTELTKRLAGLPGPAGYEDSVRAWLLEYLRPLADEVSADVMGNVIAVKRCGKPGAKLVMLEAHIDEIGFVVTGAKDGFLTFAALGGVDQRMLPAQTVRVLSDPPLFGVIDTLPPHILTAEQMDKSFEADKLCIDVGLSQQEAERLVPPGTAAVYAVGCEEMGEAWLCGKALDDRACAAIIVHVFETLCAEELNADVCCVLCTQEEVGHRGAAVAAWNLQPDVALVVDVTHGKTMDGRDVPCVCGAGAAIGIGPNMDRALSKQLIALARERGVTWQIEAVPGGNSGTDARAIQTAQSGVVTALISLPLKYMHTPVEMVHRDDMAAVAALLTAYVEGLEI